VLPLLDRLKRLGTSESSKEEEEREMLRVPDSRAALNLVWRPDEGGGEVYVGGQAAATDPELLETHNISHIVNCM